MQEPGPLTSAQRGFPADPRTTDRFRAPRSSPLSSIDKAFLVLSAFSELETELTLSQIQRATGLAMTTAHRTVRNLVDLGAMQLCDDGRYAVGIALWRLGCLAPKTVNLDRVAQPFMQSLHDRMKYPVQLLVREGDQGVFVSRCAATGPERNPRSGTAFPMHASAGGQVLLANAPRIVQENVLRGPLPRYTNQTPTDPLRLRGILEKVRVREVAISDRELRDNLVTVAAPVRDGDSKVAGAISIVIPAPDAALHPWGNIVQASARAVSRLLAQSGGHLPHTA